MPCLRVVGGLGPGRRGIGADLVVAEIVAGRPQVRCWVRRRCGRFRRPEQIALQGVVRGWDADRGIG